MLSISTWLLLICLSRHSIYIYIYGVTSSSSGLYIYGEEKSVIVVLEAIVIIAFIDMLKSLNEFLGMQKLL